MGGLGKSAGRYVDPAVNRRLHLLFFHVNVLIEAELQRDDRTAKRTGRGHLGQSRHLAELPFQRRRDRRSHHVGIGSRIERNDLNGGIVDLGQRRHRQLRECNHAHKHHADHEQRGRDRPKNE
jgi:hypothetical protein